MQTYTGEIYSGVDETFVVDDEIQAPTQQNGQAITIGGVMSAKINGGGQKLSINTYAGDIYVRKQ